MPQFGENMQNEDDFGDDPTSTLDRERQDLHQLTQQLSRSAVRHWQKTIEGAVALPAAIASGFAASTLRFVALVADSVNAFQRSTEARRRVIDEMYHRDQERRDRPPLQSRRENGFPPRPEAPRIDGQQLQQP